MLLPVSAASSSVGHWSLCVCGLEPVRLHLRLATLQDTALFKQARWCLIIKCHRHIPWLRRVTVTVQQIHFHISCRHYLVISTKCHSNIVQYNDGHNDWKCVCKFQAQTILQCREPPFQHSNGPLNAVKKLLAHSLNAVSSQYLCCIVGSLSCSCWIV